MTRSPDTLDGSPVEPSDLAERLRRTRPERRMPGRNFTKADVLIYRLAEGRVVVKDYTARGRFVRATLGRWQTSRECRAYAALSGVSGLPRFLGRMGPCRLALEHVDARPLAEHRESSLPREVFDRLERIIDEVHRRGVALVDMHHRDVLLSDVGDVHVVDLAAAWVTHPGSSGLRSALLRRLQRLDRVRLVRLRARFTDGKLHTGDHAADPRMARWYRRGRAVKALWNHLRGRR